MRLWSGPARWRRTWWTGCDPVRRTRGRLGAHGVGVRTRGVGAVGDDRLRSRPSPRTWGPSRSGAVAMGLGGLPQALVAAPRIAREAPRLRARGGVVLLGALAVAAYPPAFYTSMHLAGVAAGTVVSIGSAPLASALIERVVDGRRLTRRWTAGAALGLSGTALLCVAEAAGGHAGPGGNSTGATALGVGAGAGGRPHLRPVLLGGPPPDRRRCLCRRGRGHRLRPGRTAAPAGADGHRGPLLDSSSDAALGAYTALVPMFTGYVLFGWGLAHVPASTATTLSLLEPAVAAVLAVVVVGERLPLPGWAGLAAVVACLAVLTTPPRPARGPRPARQAVPKAGPAAPPCRAGVTCTGRSGSGCRTCRPVRR